MNRCFYFVVAVLMAVFGVACSSHRTAGWYRINENNAVEGNVLFDKADFANLNLDTVPKYGLPCIQGSIVPEKRNDWARITERLIGSRIGFVYDDSIITAPRINARIESGNFQIISEDKRLLDRIYRELVTK